MNDQQDGQLDALLRDHLRSELEGHVGASARRFATEIGQHASLPITSASAVATASSQRREPRLGSFWSIGLVGAALAATLTIVSMRNTATPMRNPAERLRAGESPAETTPVTYRGEGDFRWKTIDQGIVEMPSGGAARKYLQKTTETLTVRDPKTKRTYEYVQPSEQVIYVGLKEH